MKRIISKKGAYYFLVVFFFVCLFLLLIALIVFFFLRLQSANETTVEFIADENHFSVDKQSIRDENGSIIFNIVRDAADTRSINGFQVFLEDSNGEVKTVLIYDSVAPFENKTIQVSYSGLLNDVKRVTLIPLLN